MGKEEVNSGGISPGLALLIAFLAFAPETGGVHFRLSTPPPFLSDSSGSQAPLSWTVPAQGKTKGAVRRLSLAGVGFLEQPPDVGVSCPIWSASGISIRHTNGTRGGRPWLSERLEALKIRRRERRWAGQLLKPGLQFKDEWLIYCDNNYLD